MDAMVRGSISIGLVAGGTLLFWSIGDKRAGREPAPLAAFFANSRAACSYRGYGLSLCYAGAGA
jgi:hypothetical protein